MSVGVIGLGEVGLPVAKYLLSNGIDTYGYDVNPEAVKRAKSHGVTASHIWGDIPRCNVYIICVSTLLSRGRWPDLTPVIDVSKKISMKSAAETLISIESTIVPGTARRIYRSIFKRRCRLVHVPHRYWNRDPERHGIKQLRVIGGVNQNSLDAGVRFYEQKLEIPLYKVPSIELAETCKIVENAYRYLQISFAEELRMICEEIGLDFEELRKASNTKWNIEIPEARDGIGGHCLPKDVRYLTSLSKCDLLLKSAIKVDERYRQFLASHSCKGDVHRRKSSRS